MIDPGIAVMQPSFPASDEEKAHWEAEGWNIIEEATKEAEIIIISHYHYDHFSESPSLYRKKKLFIKNPNEYINDTQRTRAMRFFERLYNTFGGISLQDVLMQPEEKDYPDPYENFALAAKKDFGSYNSRRKELLSKWKKQFNKRVERWNNNPRIPNLSFDDLQVIFPEKRSFDFGKTRLRFTEPLFHGIEYARVGWVFATIVEYENEKFIHSSDLQGPYIEDYAAWIIQENPTILILDGPPTYLIPYMMNLINLNRVIENVCWILKETETELIIFDHHLLRDIHYKERLQKVYTTAEQLDKQIITAAEYLGQKPVILKIKDEKE